MIFHKRKKEKGKKINLFVILSLKELVIFIWILKSKKNATFARAH